MAAPVWAVVVWVVVVWVAAPGIAAIPVLEPSEDAPTTAPVPGARRGRRRCSRSSLALPRGLALVEVHGAVPLQHVHGGVDLRVVHLRGDHRAAAAHASA
jgi:hypothetical protein